MGAGEIAALIGATVTILGLCGTLVKHWMNIERERTKEDIVTLQNQIKENKDKLESARKEVHDDYVKNIYFTQMIETVNSNYQKLDRKVGDMAKDLNQLIGRVEAD
ncbi:MAG: hypothetical protein GKR93_12035 [Gammaproteobacteria bacterium]|nr:hypothetical protein [Gammaproteobacteria bacterium]